MDHFCVVEAFDATFAGRYVRVRCEACPWAVSVASDAEAWAQAMLHTEYGEARAKLAARMAEPAAERRPEPVAAWAAEVGQELAAGIGGPR